MGYKILLVSLLICIAGCEPIKEPDYMEEIQQRSKIWEKFDKEYGINQRMETTNITNIGDISKQWENVW